MTDPTQELVTWRTENGEEPRWRIFKWPDGTNNGVQGPPILAADDSLQGVEWCKAATVEVMPLATHQALEARLERAVHIVGVLRQDMRPGDPFIVGVDEFLSAFNNQPTEQ